MSYLKILDYPVLEIICNFLSRNDVLALSSTCTYLYPTRTMIEYNHPILLNVIKDSVIIEKCSKIIVTEDVLEWYLNNFNSLNATELTFECLFAPGMFEIPDSCLKVYVHKCKMRDIVEKNTEFRKIYAYKCRHFISIIEEKYFYTCQKCAYLNIMNRHQNDPCGFGQKREFEICEHGDWAPRTVITIKLPPLPNPN